MKKIIFTAAVSLLPVLAMAAAPTCADKKNDIEKELSYATQHHQTARIDGLQTALKKLDANCSDDQLKKAYQQKVDEKQAKLDKANQALQAAQQQGKSEKKIQRQKKKVAKAQAELEEAQAGH